MGTLQLPCPLQALLPSPPWFLQALEPAQPWASVVEQLPWPAQALAAPLPCPLQAFRPQQAWASALAPSFISPADSRLPPSIEPATTPPNAARASFPKSLRLTFSSSFFIFSLL